MPRISKNFSEALDNYQGIIIDHIANPEREFTSSDLVAIKAEVQNLVDSHYADISSQFHTGKASLLTVEIEATRKIEYFIALFTFASNGCLVRPRVKKLIDHSSDGWFLWRGLSIRFIHDPSFPAEMAGTLAINSSGTTGAPKEICLNINKFMMSAKHFGDLLPEDLFNTYNTFPCEYMASIFNMFMVPLVRGDNIDLFPEFHISEIPNINKHMRARDGVKKLFYMSPAMSEILISFEKRNIFNLVPYSEDNVYISTGSIISENQCIQFEKLFGVSLFNCYGVTEAYGSLSLNSKNKLPALGSLREDVSVYYAKAGNSIVRIFLQSELIFDGYIVDGVFEPMEAGIFDTCDFMQYQDTSLFDSSPNYTLIDGQTLLKPNNFQDFSLEAIFVGRKSSFVKSGSELISAIHCTDYVFSQLGCSAVLLNLSDIDIGSILALIVEGTCPHIPDLLLNIRKDLGAKYVPDMVFVIQEFPRTSIGKIQENKLVALATDAKLRKSSPLKVAWKSARLH